MQESDLIELEKAAVSFPVSASEAMLSIISEYRRLREKMQLQCHMAYNDGVITARETLSRALMPTYGSRVGHDIWSTDIAYPPLPGAVTERKTTVE